MLRTIEVRWFGQHPVPTDVRSWFDVCPGEPELQPLRRDFYLQPIKDSGLGVKVREGGLEIKQRQRSHGRVRLARSLEGLVERWVKWRFPLQIYSNLWQTTVADSASWVAIEKERLLKQYLIGEEGAVAPSTSQVAFRADCQLELTSVQVGAHRWWTIAFEADAESKTALDRLLALTREMPEEAAVRHLSIQNSFGYPQWLAALPDN